MKKILFVGNSYTYYNDMPEALLVPMAEAAGFPCQVTAVTRGAWTLSKFADPNDEEGARLRSVVAGQQYDWVILQEQSLRPVVDKDAFFRGVEALKRLLAPQTERFLLYATWGRKPGSEKLEELGMTGQEMTDKLAEAYEEAGSRFGMAVAHAGRAFAAYGAAHPEEELYHPDRSHPSAKGSAIAAETLLSALMKNS